VFLLPPLVPTVTARLVKSPKLYWTDPGLARVLAGRTDADGALFETSVLAELVRWRSWQADPPELHFYRTGVARSSPWLRACGRSRTGACSDRRRRRGPVRAHGFGVDPDAGTRAPRTRAAG